MSPQAAAEQLPPIPAEAVQEGARWRHHRPSSERVAEWFRSQPLDEGMVHEHFIGGVVLIPQGEKAKHRMPSGQRLERFEDVYTPYMQVGTRIGYFRRLAEHRGLIPVIEPVPVKRVTNPQSVYFNAHMEEGYWWHVVAGEGGAPVRYLCCTMRVAMFERGDYARRWRGEKPMPVLQGRSTKQVAGGPDPNQLAKAQTSAVGRALGIAGILTLGTGVATAEDMLELVGAQGSIPSPDAAALPQDSPVAAAPAVDPAEELSRLRSRAIDLQSEMKAEAPHGWRSFAAWWGERSKEEGWQQLSDVPLESLKGVIGRMEREHQAALTRPPEDDGAAGGDSPNHETEVGA